MIHFKRRLKWAPFVMLLNIIILSFYLFTKLSSKVIHWGFESLSIQFSSLYKKKHIQPLPKSLSYKAIKLFLLWPHKCITSFCCIYDSLQFGNTFSINSKIGLFFSHKILGYRWIPTLNILNSHTLRLVTIDIGNMPWWRYQMEHFPPYWPFVRGIHRWLVDSLNKGQCFQSPF